MRPASSFSELAPELAAGGLALFRGRDGEALALTGIVALARARSCLARALALTGICANALAFGSEGRRSNERAGYEQRSCSNGKRRAGLLIHLHRYSPLVVG